MRKFEADGHAVSTRGREGVADWFAEVTLTDVEKVKTEIALETEASAGAKASLFGLSLGLLAKLKSRVMGSAEKPQGDPQELAEQRRRPDRPRQPPPRQRPDHPQETR